MPDKRRGPFPTLDRELADELALLANGVFDPVYEAQRIRRDVRYRGEPVPRELNLIADGMWARKGEYETGHDGARAAASDALAGLADA